MRTTLAIVGTTALVVVAVFASTEDLVDAGLVGRDLEAGQLPAASARVAGGADGALRPRQEADADRAATTCSDSTRPGSRAAITASRAHKEDTGSSEVPNDNYTVEEGHRLLWYILPASARVTVLTNQATKGISATPISAAELSRIVNGGKHRKLFEPLDSGVWIRVRIDTVKELDQQYKP